MKGAIRLLLAVPALMSVLAAGAESVKTRVRLETQPDGASVIVDGKDVGTSPVMLFDLAPGRHHVKYRLDGYEDCDRVIRCGSEPLVTSSEKLTEVKGLLLLRTEPEGAAIYVNGVSIGTTPRLVTHLSAKDTYTVKFSKTGYLDQLIKVRFEGRKPLVREEKLVLASGTIEIMTEPAGAEVFVNGIPKGKSPLTLKEVPKGRAVVKFKLDGYAEEIRELTVSAGDRQTLPVPLKALPGTLRLTSVPGGARFYLNDKPVGKGELVLKGLEAGAYRIRAELEGYGTVSDEVVLENGASASKELRLSNICGSIEIRTTPPGVQIFLDGKLVGTTRGANDGGQSHLLTIENVLEGEHQLVARREGYAERTRHPKIQRGKTSQCTLKLPKKFIPNVEVETAESKRRGVLISNGAEGLTLETKPGLSETIPRDRIRKVTFLDEKKDGAKK